MLIKTLDSLVATSDLNLYQASGERILVKIPLNQHMLCNPNCVDATLGTHKIWYLKGSRTICTRVPSRTSNTHSQKLHRYITNTSETGEIGSLANLRLCQLFTATTFTLSTSCSNLRISQMKYNPLSSSFLLFKQKNFGYGELPTDHTNTQYREGCQPIIVYQRVCQ